MSGSATNGSPAKLGDDNDCHEDDYQPLSSAVIIEINEQQRKMNSFGLQETICGLNVAYIYMGYTLRSQSKTGITS